MGDATLLSARESDDLQRRAAGALLGRGLRAGDRVAFALTSSLDLLSAILGAARVGIVPVVLHAELLDHERDALLADADARVDVLDAAALSSLLDGPPVDLAPHPLARPMHYTSGTSGRPKGVWSGVLDEGDAKALYADESEQWHFAADDVHLVCSPLHHSASIRFAAGTLLAGGDVVLLEKFTPDGAVAAIEEHQPTTSFMAPAHLQRLGAHGWPNLSSFRLVAHAGSPCPSDLKRSALDAFPSGTLWEFYGATEGQLTACASEEWLERPGTVGRARSGRRLEIDDAGVVWCQAPAFARFEYWRDPAKTAAAWREDAFTVGDLGHLDDDGYLYLDGRRDDLIITGGVNVYPVEVEQVLAACPGVIEVAVFGVDDERWGQRVCAAVVIDGSFDVAVVKEWARDHVAGHKRPKDVYVIDVLPRTSTGKLRRLALPAVLGLDAP
ncbi:MAG TPA: AMP-binding protein [Acidimicrobiales bacterium]|nr:AMP-binding protein [Acidimicrobiales bacterium]